MKMTYVKGPRPSRDATCMDIARSVAKRGTCPRKQVGAIIVRDFRVVSMGYNGAAPGMPQCDEVGCGGGVEKPTTPSSPMSATATAYPNGCTRAIHAEMNAIAFAARAGAPTDDAAMYSTCATCVNCAALLVSSGIKRFVFFEPYRLKNGQELLEAAGIEVIQWTE